MNFGHAIEAVKAGKRASRKGWNGNNAVAFIGTSGVQLGWLASQADMLAEDWQILSE